MPALTVLHTADWHLGARLRDLDRSGEHAGFLEWLIRTVGDLDADLLVIAGDVFDSANPPQSALKMWYDFLAGLHSQHPRCAVAAVAGNHDSPLVLQAALAPLRGLGVRILGEMPADPAECLFEFPDKSGNPALAVAAVPFLRDRDLRTGSHDTTASAIETQLREGVRTCYERVAHAARPCRDRGLALLATGHLTVAGGTRSESERDIHLGTLGAIPTDTFGPEFDYVALGHLHRPQRAGADHIRYSGSPLALSFSEWQDTKSIRVLTFENGALTGSRNLAIPCTRPLLRTEVTAETLESELAALALPPSPLPAWLEVTTGPTAEPAASLSERIHAALAGRPVEAISIRRTAPARTDGASPAATIQEVQPEAVFDAALETSAIPEAERDPLRLTFRQLLERRAESLTTASDTPII